ncbi:MAG: sigma-54-dependent Fis family transcriptional regulator [Calditrichaeota bacterium]|nr:MAG: sigma-54-dependent Fis family transcriptional regulator [Calditrichota bacterium]
MNILLIDDDRNLGRVISHQLNRQGYKTDTFTDASAALEQFFHSHYDLVISDIQMPDINGIDLLKRIRKHNADVVIIMITAYGSVDNALEACRLGADDYITKPFGFEQLLFVIEKAVRLRKLQTENRVLKATLSEKFRFNNMIAHSAAMQNVLRVIQKVAAGNATVLIEGESGTGKELAARAIHFNSPRKDKPFITVNCPSIPANLLESELFGHVKGAFTGATSDRKGKFEQADGGTIFLDEIGDLQGDLQAKLLRVLQQQEFDRVGGHTPVHVDVRVVAATNRNLREQVRQNKFREDLYYRLSVIPVVLPPLRDRREDIPFLVDHFLKKQAANDEPYSVEPAVIDLLRQYDWPGNIRELENIVERMVTLASGKRLTIRDVPDYIAQTAAPPSAAASQILNMPPEGMALDDIERLAIEEALARGEGNQTRAAQLLHIPRHVLLYRMKKLSIPAR